MRATDNDYLAKYGWYEWPILGDDRPTPGAVAAYVAEGGPTGAEISLLADIICLEDWLRDVTTSVVRQARAGGESWDSIGRALGTSKQAAQQRYGHVAGGSVSR